MKQVKNKVMGLETTIFENDYHYKVKFVNKCIKIIRFSDNPKRVEAYKILVFKMMKDIVKKNICNFLNLLRNTYKKDMLPDRDELVASSYIIFDKCLEKFVLDKGYNFYFYYNKSLSRNFFRDYQKEVKSSKSVEVTESVFITNINFHNSQISDPVNLLEHFDFNELEIKICISRMNGQKTSEFLKENPKVLNGQYSRGLKRIKEVLTVFKNRGDI